MEIGTIDPALFKRCATIIPDSRALRRQVGTHRTDRRFWVIVPPLPDLFSLLIRAANWFNWFCTRYVIIDACKRECSRGPASRHIKISDPIELLGNNARYRETPVVVHPAAATAASEAASQINDARTLVETYPKARPRHVQSFAYLINFAPPLICILFRDLVTMSFNSFCFGKWLRISAEIKSWKIRGRCCSGKIFFKFLVKKLTSQKWY